MLYNNIKKNNKNKLKGCIKMKKWFKGINTLEELKAAYKKLAMQYHPDRPQGSTAIMQEVNAEFEMLCKVLPSKAQADGRATSAEERQNDINNAERFRDVLINIIHLEGLEIEICGSWIWVSGNTKEHKTELKASGFCWASKKAMWYWRAEEYKSKGKKGATMADIRAKYGSERVSGSFRPTLA